MFKNRDIRTSGFRVTDARRTDVSPRRTVQRVTFRRTAAVLHLRSPRIVVITCQTRRIGEIGCRVTGKRGRKGFAAPRGRLHANARRPREVESKKEDLPQGKTRWGKREEAIDRDGGGGSKASIRAPASIG